MQGMVDIRRGTGKCFQHFETVVLWEWKCWKWMHTIYTEFTAERIHLMKWSLNALRVEPWSPHKYKQGDLGLKYIQPTSLYGL